MTQEAKALLAAHQAELSELEAQYRPHREAYDALAAQLAPLEAQQREHEAAMDALKPRMHALREVVEALRK